VAAGVITRRPVCGLVDTARGTIELWELRARRHYTLPLRHVFIDAVMAAGLGDRHENH